MSPLKGMFYTCNTFVFLFFAECNIFVFLVVGKELQFIPVLFLQNLTKPFEESKPH